MRFARVEDFADRANAIVAQMDRESCKKFTRGGAVVRMNFQPRVDKRTDQPRPNRALMICAIAGPQVSGIDLLLIGTLRRKRAQAYRREHFFFHNFQHGFPMDCIEDRMIERDREQLVWPA